MGVIQSLVVNFFRSFLAHSMPRLYVSVKEFDTT
jgi:hypothetical protein